MIPALMLALLQAGPPAPVASRHETVFVDWNPRTKACLPRVNGIEVGDVNTDEGKAALVHALPDKGVDLRLLGAVGMDAIPYACMTAIVDTLHDAGFYGRIATISEPPPPPGRR